MASNIKNIETGYKLNTEKWTTSPYKGGYYDINMSITGLKLENIKVACTMYQNSKSTYQLYLDLSDGIWYVNFGSRVDSCGSYSETGLISEYGNWTDTTTIYNSIIVYI